MMLVSIRRVALLACVVLTLAGLAALPAQAASDVGAEGVSVDFTSYGSQGDFAPRFYLHDGIVFPSQRCGSAGCDEWFVGYVQSDEALVGGDMYGDVRATFTRPVRSLTLDVAQGLQGIAAYKLTAYDGAGAAIASTSLTVVQDEGVEQPVTWGYQSISLSDLARPAKSFVLEGRLTYSSFPLYQHLEYGVRTITYTFWRGSR